MTAPSGSSCIGIKVGLQAHLVLDKSFNFRDSDSVLALGLLFALFDIVVGLGILLLKRWARTIIVVNNSWILGRAAVGLAIVIVTDRKALSSLQLSPYLEIYLIASVFMLFYLLDPRVKREFGVHE
jgi:predicted transporter